MTLMPSTTKDDRPLRERWRGFVLLAACFAGLCTVFLLVATVAEAWREHVQAQWPEAMARVQRCAVEHYRESAGGGSEGYFISCRVTYPADAEAITATIRSGRVLSPAWPDPSAKIERLNDWVDAHPSGAPIAVHYNPAHHDNAVLVTTDMPLGGSRTPGNVKLMGGVAAICVALLAIVAITRPSRRL
jgi:hypothetical protein